MYLLQSGICSSDIIGSIISLMAVSIKHFMWGSLALTALLFEWKHNFNLGNSFWSTCCVSRLIMWTIVDASKKCIHQIVLSCSLHWFTIYLCPVSSLNIIFVEFVQDLSLDLCTSGSYRFILTLSWHYTDAAYMYNCCVLYIYLWWNRTLLRSLPRGTEVNFMHYWKKIRFLCKQKKPLGDFLY